MALSGDAAVRAARRIASAPEALGSLTILPPALYLMCLASRGRSVRRALSCAVAGGILFLVGAPVWAEPDVLMRAVSFALTGRDDADPKVIGDRANCVFAIGDDLFRLNNVQTYRIEIQGWHRQRAWGPEQWVAVRLHGDDVVFEETIEPPKDDGSELMRQMRESSPELFKLHHYTYVEYELNLMTKDEDRVKKAWQYIYGNGCTSK
jgi:hypothetical protein